MVKLLFVKNRQWKVKKLKPKYVILPNCQGEEERSMAEMRFYIQIIVLANVNVLHFNYKVMQQLLFNFHCYR